MYEVDPMAYVRSRSMTAAERRSWIEGEVRNFRSVSEGVTWRQVESFREDLEEKITQLDAVLPPTEHIIPYETAAPPPMVAVSRRRRQRKDAN